MIDQPIVPIAMPSHPYGPITAGQMFERTFALLRENFKLFFGIVLVLIGVEIIAAGLLGSSTFLVGHLGASPAPIARLLFIFPAVVVGGVLFFILLQIIQGALFIATDAKLAAAPTSVGEACKHAADKAGRLIGIALLVLLRTIGYVFLFYIASGVVALLLALMLGAFRHVAGATPFAFIHAAAAGTIVLIVLLVLA
ncbi:MAG: hypothetical protein ACRD28_00370, partial [Acidobacteriaceae bacterium]